MLILGLCSKCPKFKTLSIFAELAARTDARVDQMVSHGLIDELTAFWSEQRIDEQLEKRYVHRITGLHSLRFHYAHGLEVRVLRVILRIPSQNRRLAARTPPVYRTQGARAIPPRHNQRLRGLQRVYHRLLERYRTSTCERRHASASRIWLVACSPLH